jgi:L-seryl-tRNA(Ser) seleniumtransferase
MTDLSPFKSLPSVDRLLQTDSLSSLRARVGHAAVKSACQRSLQEIRDGLAQGDDFVQTWLLSAGFIDEFCAHITKHVESEFASSLVPVFNLTGTVLHTNLGRSRLPDSTVTAMAIAATNAVNVEYDLELGERGDRDIHLTRSLQDVTGGEAATVVNNNAAAVLLVLNSLAAGKEVLISRGELVEIGGSFRIPDVMAIAGCVLREVGTTNRTHLTDYANAIGPATGLIMKVHTSNYEIRGFTNTVSEVELAALAHEHNIPFVFDLGSGTLLDLQPFGLPHEPTVQEVLAVGTDLVTFSGDKLLGGPQAGLVVGKHSLVQKLKANPLKRALRVDKITLAALIDVINLYKDPARLTERLPLFADLMRPLAEIEALGERVLTVMQLVLGKHATVALVATRSQIGSGALPLDLLESRALEITVAAPKGQRDADLQRLAFALRSLPKPVIGRINNNRLLLDLRCLRDEAAFIDQLSALRF